MAEIVFRTRRDEITLDTAVLADDPEATLLDAVRRVGLPLGRSCGGEGVCRSCAVEVLNGADQLAAPNALELRQLRPRPGDPELGRSQPAQRLACQVRLPAPGSTSRVVLGHAAWGRPPQATDPSAPGGSPAPAPGATVDP
ncbi:2Fe-2S iron-sulfur cluster binding domain-containing protein [Nannocystis sp.]|uniref:2Fe-2S iron-sulfur cluster binding domain-containing protein n=1 Tax=Nannocystis sp. TaxID=1962667 RepID=UPI002422C5F9|nr:2Fe-2S iron-sulfur cluster binding domain-containing protein [Nannocystis sp.]MBK7824352.1 2Fe-2S iron-sulfur cluster binding domain-containing protein [Nannocystis sp.]MBK9754507.1 2Fe-2S iron-sulfur cluster binding domain-containing protein [Nannocystis sp.]